MSFSFATRCSIASAIVLVSFAVARADDRKGQTEPSPNAGVTMKEIADPKKWCANFVDLLKREPKSAFDMAAQFGLPAVGVDRLRQAAAKLDEASGTIIKVQLIEESQIAKALIKETYLLEQDRLPTIQTCLFYYLPGRKIWTLFGLERTSDVGRLPFK